MLKYNIHISSRYEYMRQFIESIVINGVPGDAEVIYKGRNTVYRLKAFNKSIIIKSFKLPAFFNSYIYTNFRKSKAERSYLNSKKLQQLGFRTPPIIAYGEVLRGHKLLNSYYISEEIHGTEMRNWENLPDTDGLLHGLAGEMHRLYQCHVWHKDFSPGNILFVGSPQEGYKYYYVDVNRMKFDVTDRGKLMTMFRSIHLDDNETDRLARHYAEVSGEPVDTILTEARAAHEKYITSRKKRRWLKSIFKHK